ncbi:MAG TPA: TIGR01777 family oxidoreductase [Variovorax sp.]|nr:TIGR01777 family oxidoreductase [Variovorax sp.]
MPSVLVAGATGFIGRALMADLRRDGVGLMALSRDAKRAAALLGADVHVAQSLDAIPSETRIDAIVHLAGARVLGPPWTASRRRLLLASRVEVTQALLALMRRLAQPPRVLVSASAVGYYGAVPEGMTAPLDESGPPQPGQFQSDLCSAIEHEASRAEALGVRVVRLRFGVVYGRGDGAYPMLALGARLGLGTVLGNGRQPAPWIHLEDAVGLIRFAIASDRLSGPVNAVAPDTPSQERLTKSMAKSFGRSAWLRLPAAPLRLLAGEMSTLLLDGQRVESRSALAAGYQFRHPSLEEALQDLARKG